jgi:serine/threonine-protein kinase
MSDLAEKPITTESPGGDRNPIFSPDGRSIAYWDGGDGAIRKIGLTGGATVTLCRATGPGGGAGPLGMTWGDDSIFFTEAGGIMRVSENSGTPELVVHADSGEQFAEPQILPDGEHLLFTIATGTELNRFDKARIVAESLKSHERRTLIDSGGAGRYLPTGHLLYAFGGVLFAVPFDLKRMAVTGGPVPVIEGVRRGTAAADVAVSSTGTLVYLPGSALATSALVTLGFFDRKGKAELLKVPPGAYQLPRLSPDGKYIAFETDDGRDGTIWVYDLSGTSALRRLTFEGQGRNRFPVWSADSQRVTFQSDREKDLGIFWQRADGGGTAERLTKADEGTAHIPEAWSADGAILLYNAAGKDSMAGLWTFTLKDRRAERFDAVVSPLTTLTGAAFSPDGKWVAYASGEARSGAAVYVQPFPPTGAKYQISRSEDRGHHPLWSPDGKELFFTRAAGNSLDVVHISTQPTFSFGEAVNIPRPFSNDSPAAERPYDISRDGQRLLGLINPDQAPLSGTPQVPRIQVVLNWFEELKAKVPTK